MQELIVSINWLSITIDMIQSMGVLRIKCWLTKMVRVIRQTQWTIQPILENSFDHIDQQSVDWHNLSYSQERTSFISIDTSWATQSTLKSPLQSVDWHNQLLLSRALFNHIDRQSFDRQNQLLLSRALFDHIDRQSVDRHNQLLLWRLRMIKAFIYHIRWTL